MKRNPTASIARETEEGAAPQPLANLTVCWDGTRRSAGSWASIFSTIGAPQRWVTRCSAISRNICAGSTLRRHIWVPPAATTAHGYDQPEQWNIGSVQR